MGWRLSTINQTPAQTSLTSQKLRILVRGGGDLASGVALRLHRAGWHVLITELAQPLAVRRLVSFSDAVYAGKTQVEEVTAVLVDNEGGAVNALNGRQIPVMVDPDAQARRWFAPHVLIDARMEKRAPELEHPVAGLSIGLGPGFVAGENCHAVIETNRGPFLGRVIWHGAAEPDSRTPEKVAIYTEERVLRSPGVGIFTGNAPIGSHVDAGDIIGMVDSIVVKAPFSGVIRGLVHDGLPVTPAMKIGDIDPRDEPRISRFVSDKSLAVAGGVLEAILSFPAIRSYLW